VGSIEGNGFRVSGSGLQGVGCIFEGSGRMIWGLGFMAEDEELRVRVYG